MMTVYFRKPVSVASPATIPAAPPAAPVGAVVESLQEKPVAETVSPKKLPVPVVPATLPLLRLGGAESRGIVSISSIDFSMDAIVISAGSVVTDFKTFTLSDPERLVIDIPSANSDLAAIA